MLIEQIMRWAAAVMTKHTILVVALIVSYLWLRNRHLPRQAIARLSADPEQSELFNDAVAGLTVLGIKRSAACKRIRNVMKKHPEAKELSEIVKLAFDVED